MQNRYSRILFFRFTIILFFIFLVSPVAFAQGPADTCRIPGSTEIKFITGGIALGSTAKNTLNAIAKKLKDSPHCKLSVIAHGYNSYKAQQLGWDRIMTVMEYLYAKGIPEDQLIFLIGYEGNPAKVELVPTMEDGPHLIPPPYPPLSKRKKST